jgi:hypothetical protein
MDANRMERIKEIINDATILALRLRLRILAFGRGTLLRPFSADTTNLGAAFAFAALEASLRTGAGVPQFGQNPLPS